MFSIVSLLIVFVFLAAMIFLPDTGVYDHGFVFVDDRYQNLATIAVCTIPFLLVAMLRRLPKTSFRTCMNCLVIPIAFCSAFVIMASTAMMVFHLPSPFHCSVGPIAHINGLGIRLIYKDYVSKFDSNDGLCILRLERDIFGSILKEYKTLAIVDPAPGANLEFMDNGAKVKLVVPYHYSLIPINRVFSTDWLANASQPCIKIHRTY